jgi:hypothetical protein
VNEPVSHGADGDAAVLSRPWGRPEATVSNHDSPFRLSLITGQTASENRTLPAPSEYLSLLTPTDPAEIHARWLLADVPTQFNESVYYPYTSLKHHTLLTGALLAAYRDGYDFADLALVAEVPDTTDVLGDHSTDDLAEATEEIPTIQQHWTVLWTPELALQLTPRPGDRPAAPIGSEPARRFGQTWSQLSAQPLDVDGEREWRVLDAQLRRLGSWSAALAYIEEFIEFWPAGRTRGESA